MIPNEDRLKSLYDRVNERIDRFEAERRQDEEFLAQLRREDEEDLSDKMEQIFGVRSMGNCKTAMQ